MFKDLSKREINVFILGKAEDVYEFAKTLQEILKRIRINIIGVYPTLNSDPYFLKRLQQKGIPLFNQSQLSQIPEVELIIDLWGTKDAEGLIQQLGLKAPVINRLGAFLIYSIAQELKNRIRFERQACYIERMSVISGLAHSLADSIRNPLMAIGGFAKSLVESPQVTPQEVKKKAQVILAEAQKLEQVLKEVSNLAKPYILRKEVADINGLIEEVCFKCEGFLKEQKTKLVKKLEPEPIFTLVDVELFKKALEAIIKTLIETRQEEGLLTISSEICLDSALITIMSTGAQMVSWNDQPAQISHFSWEDKTFAYLNMARKIIEDHGGKFLIYTKPEAGNKVLIEIPIELPKKTPI